MVGLILDTLQQLPETSFLELLEQLRRLWDSATRYGSIFQNGDLIIGADLARRTSQAIQREWISANM
jgi:hypothetical protein